MMSTLSPLSFTRRSLLGLAVLATTTWGAQAIAADAYPSQPLKMVVGFAAGGGNDVIARIIAKEMQQSMGQTIVVENRAGAGGLIAADVVAKAQPNGYTLLLGSTGSNTVAPLLASKLSFDPRKDLAPVSLVAESGNVLLVNAGVPANSVKELVALARKDPGTLNYASSGNGSTLHLAGALFAKQANVNIVHVPYRGNSQALTDVSGGQVQMTFSGIPPALQSAKTGQTKILAVTTKERVKSLPNIPTIAEAGVPGYEFSTWYAVFTTGGTDPAIVERLAAEVKKAVAKPEVQAMLAAQGVEPSTNTPAQMRQKIDTELTQWGRDLKAFGITAQ
jgi:tripartite-type tricarboxylate transporter receptor subunit TctC